MKTTRVYIQESLYNEVTKLYGKKEEAMNRAVSGFLLIRKISLQDLATVLSENDKAMLLAAFYDTGYSLDAMPARDIVIACLRELTQYTNEQGKTVPADKAPLLRKLRNEISDIELVFLLEEINRYYETNQTYQPGTFLA